MERARLGWHGHFLDSRGTHRRIACHRAFHASAWQTVSASVSESQKSRRETPRVHRPAQDQGTERSWAEGIVRTRSGRLGEADAQSGSVSPQPMKLSVVFTRLIAPPN